MSSPLRSRHNALNDCARQLLRQGAGKRKRESAVFRDAQPGHTGNGELVASMVFSARRRRSGGARIRGVPGRLFWSV